jgi:hypothetical protein
VRPLPLAAFLIWAAPAAAQHRAGAAAEAAVPTVNPVLGLGSGGAPQLLTFSAPSLSGGLTPILTPAALTPAPGFVAAPYAATALPQPLIPTVLKPARVVPETREALGDGPDLLKPVRRVLDEHAPDGLDALDEQGMVRLTKALFGEGSAAPVEPPGKGAYLRPDKPLSFGSEDFAAYETALEGKRGGEKEQRALVDASRELLENAGVATRLVWRNGAGLETYPALEIVPVEGGSELNKLAWNLHRRHGTALVYAPARLTGQGATAAFNHSEKTMYLPHFGKSGTYSAVLHESHHSNYAARQERGDLSPFLMAALAKRGMTVVPGAQHYAGYVSMEELTGHSKTIKHLTVQARRRPPKSWWTNYEIDVEAMTLQDLSRTAWHLAGRMLTDLKAGAKVERVPDGNWVLAELGPIKGGAWFKLDLVWCTVYIPVLDEPEPPKKTGLAKLFSRRAETPAERAARRSAEAVRAWVLETRDALAQLRSALAADDEDWNRINALADKVTSAGPRAEKAFKAPEIKKK